MTAAVLAISWLLSGAVTAKLWLKHDGPVTWFRVFIIICGAVMGYGMVFVALVTSLIEAKFWNKPVWPK